MPAYDPEAKLDDHKEGWIALAREGGPFLSRAASELIRGLPYNPRCNGEIRYWLVYSALSRGDARAARVYVNDWENYKAKPGARVTKWVPGDHYHTLGEKFDTLDDAINYLRSRGCEYDGFSEQHAYRREGD